jgi:Ca2+-binding RTX toxin-like protein
MPRFTGTRANETISPEVVSTTVTSDPPGSFPGDGDDTLGGHAGNDILFGAGGNDRLNGGKGVDALSGGDGDDVYVVDNSADQVVEAVGQGIDAILAFVDFTLSAGAEIELVYAKAGSQGSVGLALTGNSFGNRLTGYDGNDALIGGAGGDTLEGRGGDDTLRGGLGNDTYYVDDSGDLVFENAREGTDTIYARSNYSLGMGQSIEVLRAHAATTGLALTGNDLPNTIVGGAGGDVLNGGLDNDTLLGGAGDDRLHGGSNGNELLSGGAGDDKLNGGAREDRLIGGDGNDKLVGGAGTDWLSGGSGNDILEGGTNTDLMAGGAGDDTLIANGPDDLMKGGTGNDSYHVPRHNRATPPRIVEEVGAGIDTVYAAYDYALPAGQEIEVLQADAGTAGLKLTGNAFDNTVVGGTGDDKLSGSTGDDQLNGGMGNDKLSGSKGSDTLNGDAGNDILSGGVGSNVLTGGSDGDIFQFDSPIVVGEITEITDFTPGLDRIAFASSVFTALDPADSLPVDAFHIGNAAHDADDRIIYEASTGRLFYDSNGTAAGGSIQFAEISSGLALTNSDFLVV